MSGENQAHMLVALQDLEEMIREAEDPHQRARLESMGFPVTGLEELHTARKKLEEQIGPGMSLRYRRLRQRTGRAIVPVVGGACTGCFTNIPSVFTSSINRGKVISCENCGRMLYWP
jgi:predicted  nucleic acid-binding Zn-ribbon protein